jgi:hypothetical protein
MGRGFSEEEINELKEQFELFDMMGDGECWEFLLWGVSFGCCGNQFGPIALKKVVPVKVRAKIDSQGELVKERYNGTR